MDAIQMIKERRSVRKFKEEKVDRQVMKNILSAAAFAPSWANTQIARYTIIEDAETIKQVADKGMSGFAGNMNTVAKAPGLVIVSHVKGQSGYAPDGSYMTKKENGWEMFDAGIATQTFCLAAHEQGVGTVIMGIFDEDVIAQIIDLPEDQVVSAVIPYGYIIEAPQSRGRKPVEELVRFI